MFIEKVECSDKRLEMRLVFSAVSSACHALIMALPLFVQQYPGRVVLKEGIFAELRFMGSEVTIAPISCTLSDLFAFTTNPEQCETIVELNQPFELRVRVEFSRSGAIALMPLALTIRVDFFAKAYGAKDTLLGTAQLTTQARTLIYQPTVAVESAATVGLQPEKVYCVSALLQVGAQASPALITGHTKISTIQTYTL